MYAVDLHRPRVAGNVPVQLVELADVARFVKEPDRVANAVSDDDGAIRVVRAGDVDVVAAGPAVVDRLVLDDQRLAGVVGDAAVLDAELGGATLRRVVVKGEVAIEPVPRPREADGEPLDYVERSILVDGEERVKLPQAYVAFLRARRLDERAEKKCRDR